MTKKELQARIDALEKLVAVLLRSTGHERSALNELRMLASDPQKKWMSEYWWHRTSAMNETDIQALADLQKVRGETFPD